MMNETVFPLEEYVLFADRNKSVSGLNKRMLFFLLPLVLLSFAFSHFLASGFSVTTHSKIPPYAAQQIQVPFSPGTKSILTLFPWLLVGECALLYLVRTFARACFEPIYSCCFMAITRRNQC